VKRAMLKEIRDAVDAAAAYLDVGNVTLLGAVDLACDYLGIVDDRDRRIVRNAVEHRLAQPRPSSARRSA
jgi:hypothetical protein